MKAKKVNYKQWTGYKVVGTQPAGYGITKDPTDELEGLNGLHALMDVVAAVESPFWGTVQNYDGVGMSAGILHNIAVLRDGRQGSLGPLLRAIEVSHESEKAIDARRMLWDALADHSIYVAQDGVFRSTRDGTTIAGPRLLEVLSGHPKGKASTATELARAKNMAELFHNVFCHFHDVQFEFAYQWMLSSNVRDESFATMLALGMFPRTNMGPSQIQEESMSFWMTPLVQLPKEHGVALQAMIFYHAHSVNAPGKAINVLQKVVERHTKRVDTKKLMATPETGRLFCADLIRALATAKYGAWHDTTDGANRYDRTRRALERHPYVDMSIMPKDFKV